jgi:hypothetical protein
VSIAVETAETARVVGDAADADPVALEDAAAAAAVAAAAADATAAAPPLGPSGRSSGSAHPPTDTMRAPEPGAAQSSTALKRSDVGVKGEAGAAAVAVLLGPSASIATTTSAAAADAAAASPRCRRRVALCASWARRTLLGDTVR